MFHLLILNSLIKSQKEVIFEGQATSVILPGQDGEFEVLDFHKPIVSRLKKGIIVVDNAKEFPVLDGLVKMDRQSLIAVVEPAKAERPA